MIHTRVYNVGWARIQNNGPQRHRWYRIIRCKIGANGRRCVSKDIKHTHPKVLRKKRREFVLYIKGYGLLHSKYKRQRWRINGVTHSELELKRSEQTQRITRWAFFKRFNIKYKFIIRPSKTVTLPACSIRHQFYQFDHLKCCNAPDILLHPSVLSKIE